MRSPFKNRVGHSGKLVASWGHGSKRRKRAGNKKDLQEEADGRKEKWRFCFSFCKFCVLPNQPSPHHPSMRPYTIIP